DSLLQKVNFDVIFYENLEAVSLLANIINRKSPASIKVYDAHNVDSELWMQKSNSENIVLYREYAKKALLTEKSLFKKADIFFSCSQRDNEKLVKINNGKIRGTVIPNGVDTELNPFDTNPTKHLIKNIIFCGSLGYFPNKEGLRWFYTNVFPLVIEKFPSVTLTVIGNVTDKADYAFLQNDEAVNFVGKVESVIPYYKNASVSIVPLKSGSGTRLKILEAMSLGNPVVSSSIGAEGIEYSDNTNILIADEPAAFASQIAFLLQNEKAFNKIRKNGRELVHKVYAWNKIGEQMNKSLEEVFKKKVKL
ncbi:MAG TPA: glycosyltransferase family 4 protein, partial [Segetibacter sp.]